MVAICNFSFPFSARPLTLIVGWFPTKGEVADQPYWMAVISAPSAGAASDIWTLASYRVKGTLDFKYALESPKEVSSF